MAEVNNTNITETSPSTGIEWTKILIGIVLFSIVITTILGNLLVLVAVYREKRLQTKFNFYIVNLALTDFLVAITGMTFYTVDNILGYWPFGEVMCGVWVFFDYGMTFASVFTLIVISVDRFWSVTWRMHYRINHTKKKCVILIIAVWIFTICLWLPACIVDRINNYEPMICRWDPVRNREFVIVIATVGFHFPCFVLVFCYIKVFYMLRKRRKIKAAMNTPSTVQNHDVNTKPTASKVQNNEILSLSNLSTGKNRSIQRLNSGIQKVPYLIPLDRPKLQPISPKESSQGGETSRASSGDKGDNNENEQNSDCGHNDNGRNNDQTPNPTDNFHEKREAKVFKTLTYIIVGYIICWVPFHFVFDITTIAPHLVPELVYNITFWMSYFNSTINPFLYNFSSPDFKKAFRKILSRG